MIISKISFPFFSLSVSPIRFLQDIDIGDKVFYTSIQCLGQEQADARARASRSASNAAAATEAAATAAGNKFQKKKMAKYWRNIGDNTQ